jgi:inhibitor of KinA
MVAMQVRSIRAVGDSALRVSLGAEIDLQVNRQVHALAAAVDRAPFRGFEECQPSYASLLIHYDPMQTDYADALQAVRERIALAAAALSTRPRTVELPVTYGGEAGPDLGFVAAHAGISEEEVIRRHSAPLYPVYLMGFTPGFPYLGGMDPQLAAPRLDSPRAHVPVGSVGIAGEQTGIYPLESPGGWRIIGRTALRLFDLAADPPCLLAPGDLVRFVPQATR